jgi:hypothetical protein
MRTQLLLQLGLIAAKLILSMNLAHSYEFRSWEYHRVVEMEPTNKDVPPR